ncbi:hypothetical protein BDN71DRAFT_1455427 [Pleurotus eryngii]|uniref:Uncharacterized protein n=1 Tax=Pleurotus eryngii TaxID=5323 RepID=A0A9P6DAM4_PLEER|nr:hypothetical protein BDN71DRAFT_1455427 [Pleurotus eryngii]
MTPFPPNRAANVHFFWCSSERPRRHGPRCKHDCLAFLCFIPLGLCLACLPTPHWSSQVNANDADASIVMSTPSTVHDDDNDDAIIIHGKVDEEIACDAEDKVSGNVVHTIR